MTETEPFTPPKNGYPTFWRSRPVVTLVFFSIIWMARGYLPALGAYLAPAHLVATPSTVTINGTNNGNFAANNAAPVTQTQNNYYGAPSTALIYRAMTLNQTTTDPLDYKSFESQLSFESQFTLLFGSSTPMTQAGFDVHWPPPLMRCAPLVRMPGTAWGARTISTNSLSGMYVYAFTINCFSAVPIHDNGALFVLATSTTS